MDVSLMRAEFTVFVIDRAASEVHSLVDIVRTAGYCDAQFYPTLDAALAIARQNPPHMVLLDYQNNIDAAESFLIDLQATSPEISVILVCTAEESLAALQLVGRGLAYDSILRPMTSTLELIQKLDRGAERMFFQFESEQIKEHLTVVPAMGSAMTAAGGATNFGPGPRPGSERGLELSRLNDFMARMSTTRDLDQAIRSFMESMSLHLADAPVLYFKYVPSHMSILVTQAVQLPIEKIRGLGVDLKKEDASLIPDLLNHPSKIEGLHNLIRQAFKQDQFFSFPHQVDGETVGLFVILSGASRVASVGGANWASATSGAEGFFQDPMLIGLKQAFDLGYKLNITLKEKHALDILDVQTGLINRRHLSLRINEEISRSRRIFLPVSLIAIDIDHFRRLNDRIGFRQADSVLKMVAMILKKTARVSDIVARTGPDDIVLLLPHTAYKGAAVKAERLRRMIEATRFPILEGQVDPLTISCGVSEYPSFCNDAEGLVRTADEALTQVKRAGGNKICLTTVAPGFQMDFLPLEVPSATGGPRSGDPL